MKNRKSLLIIIAVMLIAFVLRPPVAQIGPILSVIQIGLGATSTEMALLTAIPVLCFGFGAFASPALVRIFGINRSMIYLLALLLLATIARPYFGYFGLIIGTTVAGLSIAVANVLLPSIVRERFPGRIALMTSAYTTVLAASASFAAAISFPSASFGGWQFSLMIWALPILIATLLAFSLIQGEGAVKKSDSIDHREQWSLVFKSPITWWVMALFGLQSLGFYALLAWLPTVAVDSGMDPSSAGGLLSLMTIIGVPVRFVIAANIGRWFSNSIEGVVISLVTALGIGLLLGGLWLPAAILIGIGQASSFPLALSLISTRASNTELTTILSSVAQGLGYLVAAAGTFLFGVLGSSTGTWSLSIYFLIAITLMQVISAWFAGKKSQI